MQRRKRRCKIRLTNKLASVLITIGYLILVFVVDFIVVDIVGVRRGAVSDWWGTFRVLLMFWAIFVYIFARTWDRNAAHNKRIESRKNKRKKMKEKRSETEDT